MYASLLELMCHLYVAWSRLREALQPDELFFIGQNRWTQTICTHWKTHQVAFVQRHIPQASLLFNVDGGNEVTRRREAPVGKCLEEMPTGIPVNTQQCPVHPHALSAGGTVIQITSSLSSLISDHVLPQTTCDWYSWLV